MFTCEYSLCQVSPANLHSVPQQFKTLQTMLIDVYPNKSPRRMKQPQTVGKTAMDLPHPVSLPVGCAWELEVNDDVVETGATANGRMESEEPHGLGWCRCVLEVLIDVMR